MLTLAQLKLRQTGITATDVVTIAGENPWSSAANVYESKFMTEAELKERMNAFPKDRELNGQLFEPALAQRYVVDMAEKLTIVESESTYRSLDCEWALATPDRFVFRGSKPVAATEGQIADWLLECKLVGSRVLDAWLLGDADVIDADRIPPYVYTQVQWQLRVLGYKRCDVAALLGGTQFRRFRVDRDDEYIAALDEIAADFWTNNVLARRPPDPDGSKGYDDFLARRFPNRVKARIEPPAGAAELVQRYAALRRTEVSVGEEKKKVLQALSLMSGESAGFEGEFGKVTSFLKRGRVDVSALAKGEGIEAAVLDRYRGRPEASVRVTPAKEEKKEDLF